MNWPPYMQHCLKDHPLEWINFEQLLEFEACSNVQHKKEDLKSTIPSFSSTTLVSLLWHGKPCFTSYAPKVHKETLKTSHLCQYLLMCSKNNFFCLYHTWLPTSTKFQSVENISCISIWDLLTTYAFLVWNAPPLQSFGNLQWTPELLTTSVTFLDHLSIHLTISNQIKTKTFQ